MKKLLLLPFVVLLFLLCGCASREIDRGYLVSAVGFSEQEGYVNLYIETLSSSDTADRVSERVVLTAGGVSIQNAFDNLKQTLTKPLYFEQLGTVVFEKNISDDAIRFLKDIPDISYGIFLVKTDNIDKLFMSETPNGLLGYDIIGLLKTNGKTTSELYKINRDSFHLPTINLGDNGLYLTAKE